MFDLHMHTTYCDGKNSAEEMIISAIDKGLDTVGLSGHSFTPHDVSYCMSREGTESYIREVRSLADKYSGSIRVLTGIERDYYADISNEAFDYVIGSLHYLFKTDNGCCDKETVPEEAAAGINDSEESGAALWTDVDDNPDKLIDFAFRYYGGDLMCLAELYYETLEDIVSVTDCDIIGHFDLITKFNERFALDGQGRVIDLYSESAAAKNVRPLFDTSDERYIAAWKKAIDRIFEETVIQRCGRGDTSDLAADDSLTGADRNILHPNRLETLGLLRAGDKPVFEINTGAISRGYRTTPYPAQDQIEYIKSRGGILILSSDSHSSDAIGNRFEELKHLTQITCS